MKTVFLSTLSLRRATPMILLTISLTLYFYPRSPCGERRHKLTVVVGADNISIHALLAESDGWWSFGRITSRTFLSTLSLRRATSCGSCVGTSSTFLSTLSLRRATDGFSAVLPCSVISIHALLAESDRKYHPHWTSS